MPTADATTLEAPARLAALRRSRLLDSPPDETFDRLTRLAARLLHAPVSLLSLVDRDRQYFKSVVGLREPWASARETPLSHSFCQHVVAGGAPFVVEDARTHPLVEDNKAIEDLGAIAYAGIPLRSRDGQTLGSLCVIDDQPRRWTADELAILEDLAGAAMTGMELHAAAHDALEVAGALEAERLQRDALLDATAEGICGVDRDGRCIFVNVAGSRLLGYSRDEMVGQDLHALIHHTRPDGRPYPQSDCAMLRTLRDGTTVRREQELLWRGDGSSFVADYSALPITADGATRGAVVTFIDVSEHQGDQRILSTQYSVARALAEAHELEAGIAGALRIVGGIWHWEVGLAWRHDEATDQLIVSSTWQRQEDSPSIAAFVEASRSMRLRRDEGVVGAVWRTGEAATVSDVTVDPRYLRTGVAQAAGLHSAVVLPARVGQRTAGVIELYARREGPIDEEIVEAAAAVALQLGQYLERMRTAEALVVARRAIAATTTGITISDPSRPDNPIIYVNPAFTDITGYEEPDVIGRNCRFLQGPDTESAAVDVIRRALREGQPCRVVLLNYRKDGTAFWNDLSISPVTTPDGNVSHFIGVQTDATERIRNEEQLRTATRDAELANAAKSIFLANVSHELRTPLNAVIGYSELLQEEVADLGADQLVPDLEKINIAGRHLLSLINDVLDLAKIEAGRMELDLRPVDVAGLVRDVAATVEPLMRARGNRFLVDCTLEATAELDATKLRQALLNLLANAAKFTDHGEVSLIVERTDRNGGELEFRIQDTGIGLTDDEIQRLFAPFAQAGASVANEYGGTGLGLALTRDVARLMGGDVTVQSVPREGSRFTVRIPYRERSWTPPTMDPKTDVGADLRDVPDDDGSEEPSTDRATVLVIDDDPSVARLLRKTVGRQYHVAWTSTGAEGLARAAELRPLAIVLDVVMPTMTGWEVLARLKADPELAVIPVVLLTMVDDRRLGRELGADEFMTKPVDRQQIRKVLERYRSRIANAGRVLLVGDAAELDDISTALRQDGWDVELADTAEAALPRLAHDPHVVLIDLAHSGGRLPALLEALHGRADNTALIALSPSELDAATRDALVGGAATVIGRSTLSLAEVVRQIGAKADTGSEPRGGSRPRRRSRQARIGDQE